MSETNEAIQMNVLKWRLKEQLLGQEKEDPKIGLLVW